MVKRKQLGFCLYCKEPCFSDQDIDIIEIPFFMSRKSRIFIHKKCREREREKREK